jgi:hypothetical protein
VDTASARVRLVKIAAASVEIEVFAYVLTNDSKQFLDAQQDLLFAIMNEMEADSTGTASTGKLSAGAH